MRRQLLVALLLVPFSPGFGLTPAGAKSGPVNLTGTWGLEYMGRDAPIKMTFVFKQEGEKLSGVFSGVGPYPEASVTGVVKGNKVVFGWDFKGGMSPQSAQSVQTITFKGTIDSATRMTGKVGSPFCGLGCAWTATKKK
jgi:hypothetical protein